MNIGEQKMGDVTVLSPERRLDSNTAEFFEKLILGKIDEGNSKLIIDFSALDYISSAGLRVLLMAAKRIKAEQGGMALCGLKAHIREVFEISGFLPILTIVDDIDSAMASVGATV
ncbi:MAG: STAS domain-containing protein [Gammaproteobacteria bacterium]|nr:STAS domain-containing protein [Gammaproteobacteria bacterium]